MNILKDKIKTELIKRLTPLKTKYKEIDNIIIDLNNNKFTSLNKFINDNYEDLNYTKEFKKFVTSLVSHDLINKNYLNLINKDNKSHTKETEDEVLTLDDDNIKKLREKILETQLLYLNDVKGFINKLENMDSNEIYHTLLDLNDIRFIQHSISKLSLNTLNKLLIFIENILKENNHNLINIFIEEAIKKNLHKRS